MYASRQAAATCPDERKHANGTRENVFIPRIDVEAQGALAVTQTLLDADALIFGVVAAAPASPAAAPGATYDLRTGLVDIPVLRIGTATYTAKPACAAPSMGRTAANSQSVS